MLKRPNDKQVLALAQIQNHAAWNTVFEWFETMLEHQDVENRVLLDQKLNQGQGAAQVLAYIISETEKSKGNVIKIKNKIN